MSFIEFDVVQARRQAMRDDAGATTTTKDALARSLHHKNVRAVGAVHDVTGSNEELTLHLAVDGEILICPLVRVHGRSMEDTVIEVTSWRKGDTVEVGGRLLWQLFTAEIQIEVLTAAKLGAGT